MAGPVRETLIYAMADALGMNLTMNEKLVVEGEALRPIKIGGVEVDMKMKVVSSSLRPEGYMLMLRSKGNLALLITVKGERPFEPMTLHLLNIAKMDHPHGWLEKYNPKSVEEAVEKLRPAIAKSFHKISRNEWADVA
jgi:hypothetical protein